MKRNFAALGQETFDLLVIGGGIYGAWTAYDAALSGLRVALVEKTDWAAGTSSSSSKLIHGGLRYLEHLWFGLVRNSLIERARLLKLAPHRVQPLRFMLPVYEDSRAGMLKLKAGLTLYDAIAGLTSGVDRHSRVTANEIHNQCPFLNSHRLQGGFVYGDAMTDDARLTLEIVAGALDAGAVAVNYAKAESIRMAAANGPAEGAIVSDELGESRLEVRARVTVLATGPWGLLPGFDYRTGPRARLTKGVHLVMPRLSTESAVLLTAKSDGRVFFLIPWNGMTLLGTTDTDFRGEPEEANVLDEDIDYLLGEVAARLSTQPWTPDDIRGSFVGLRTLRGAEGFVPSSITREWSLEQPARHLLMPIGGKLTSARAEGAKIVSRVCSLLGRKHKCLTADRPLPWCPEGCGSGAGEVFESWLGYATARGESLGLDGETATAIAFRYGSRVAGIHDIIGADTAGKFRLKERIIPDFSYCRAEAVYAASCEMAMTVEDTLRRRTPLAVLTQTDENVKREINALMKS